MRDTALDSTERTLVIREQERETGTIHNALVAWESPSAGKDLIENRLLLLLFHCGSSIFGASSLTVLHSSLACLAAYAQFPVPMRQDLLFHQKRFNALKTKSLAGDVSATSELDQMCGAHEVGTLAEIMPIVKRHLHTLPPLRSEVDRWMELPEILNTLSTMNLLTHFLNKGTPAAPVLDRLCVLCPFLGDWVSFLFSSMGIPTNSLGTPIPLVHSVIVRDITLLFLALFPIPRISALLSTPNHLLLLIRDAWIWASEMGHDFVSECLGGLLVGALSCEDLSELPLSEQSVYPAILGRPIEVGKAAVQCLVKSLDLDLPTTKLGSLQSTLDMVFRIRRRSDEVRRSMIANDVLRWLCVLARRLTTMRVTVEPDQLDRVGRIILLIVQEVNVFISLTRDGLRIALQHHLIESFLQLEPFLHSTDFFRSSAIADELRLIFPVLISQFQGYLIFRSYLPLIRKSVRDAANMHLPGQLRRGGEVETTYGQFLDALTVRGDWLDRYTSSEANHCFCVNPTCPCKTGGSVSCPITMKKCTRCSFATYCSRACQKEHWKLGGHRIHCTRLQSAWAGGTNLLPVSPKDTEMIYALIRHEMAGRPDLFSPPNSQTDSYHLQKERSVENSDVVFRFDFSSTPDSGVSSQDTLGFVSLSELDSALSLTSEIFMYRAHWDGCLARARSGDDPPVLITMSRIFVIEVTSFHRISKSLYPVEIFEDTLS